ncbi:nicotinate-nucleotide adenylyltransferase [Knoellia locipacati]|uniref:Probable nicotinate-nucleotide adenylyltransferase n=1 Tax=Knoellia locipacati TaxID=882824 RepID=A0A512SVJ0_9MICO|nr:putative nicotinate-nucleotide adenylyltransferase [Knoellia locipacati]
MGGTFDPIHHGHLVAASEVQSLFDLDEVIFVPTGEPWQKADKVVSEAEHRYLMTVVATASNPHFLVSRVDVDREGPTYTIDTLRDLRAQHPDDELFFITGADALAQILSWKDVDELWELAHFIGVTRPGYELSEYGLPEDRVTLQEVPAMAISSTDCRDRVSDGEPVWYLVPDGVVQYINKHHLYAGGPGSASGSPSPLDEESRASH